MTRRARSALRLRPDEARRAAQLGSRHLRGGARSSSRRKSTKRSSPTSTAPGWISCARTATSSGAATSPKPPRSAPGSLGARVGREPWQRHGGNRHAVTERAASGPARIVVRGARQHNLQSVDVEIPRDRLVVITGLSGSGKSSLAFDTIYAEGQRRYVESLVGLRAPVPRADEQARRRLDRGPLAGDLDRAARALAQPALDRRHHHRDRTTTCACSSRASAQPHCSDCGKPIASQSVQQMTRLRARARRRGDGRACRSWRRSCAIGRASTARSSRASASRASCARASTASCASSPTRSCSRRRRSTRSTWWSTGSRWARTARARIAESIEAALRLADGLVLVDVGPGARGAPALAAATPARTAASPIPRSRRACSRSTARTAPARRAAGSARATSSTRARVVPDAAKSLAAGAIAPWSGRRVPRYYAELLAALATHYGVSLDTPWRELPRARARRDPARRRRAGDRAPRRAQGRGKARASSAAGTACSASSRAASRPRPSSTKDELARYRSAAPVPRVRGHAPAARGARRAASAGASIADLCRALGRRGRALPRDARARPPAQRAIAERVLKEIRDRLALPRARSASAT